MKLMSFTLLLLASTIIMTKENNSNQIPLQPPFPQPPDSYKNLPNSDGLLQQAAVKYFFILRALSFQPTWRKSQVTLMHPIRGKLKLQRDMLDKRFTIMEEII